MNAPACIINGSRQNMIRLATDLANIPTKSERSLGWMPMQEPYDAP